MVPTTEWLCDSSFHLRPDKGMVLVEKVENTAPA